MISYWISKYTGNTLGITPNLWGKVFSTLNCLCLPNSPSSFKCYDFMLMWYKILPSPQLPPPNPNFMDYKNKDIFQDWDKFTVCSKASFQDYNSGKAFWVLTTEGINFHGIRYFLSSSKQLSSPILQKRKIETQRN